jgi:tetratricopeptide (TPR) repeat protein
MGKVGRIALQGTSWGFLSPLLLSFLSYTTTSGISAAADDPPVCGHPIARVVSIQGSVEVQRTGQTGWSAVSRLDTPLCDGDKLRTAKLSRSALFVQPESLVRVDQNTTISVGQTGKETLIEFFQSENVAADTPQTCGAGYFISRFPKKLKVNTPFFNAAIEGTEFLVAMRCDRADLSVFEGKVLASSLDGATPAQSVGSGETFSAGGTEPPAMKVLLKPADAVQWTLYYPPLTPAGAIVTEDCRSATPDDRASCLIARAEQRLRAGRVEEAQANITDALAVAPYSSDAKALLSIISLARNDKVEALRLAGEAVDSAGNSTPAWLALSYAQQADFKLEAALASAKRAADLTPSSALALTRVAELQLSLGWTREAEKTARQAVEANPSESRAHMILGFVHLAQIKVKEAREDFGQAIENDSTEPLSRLGLGLAIIREGKLVEGREQIEIAVALDPTSSLIRSYVGKAYYEENSANRDQLASVQFELAKTLDPKDPTPWFYGSILKQSHSQPVDAFMDLQRSVVLNDERAIYRSQFLLDSDSAARMASLARIYSDTGFDRVAVNEVTNSLAIDPGNSSAHGFLSELYETTPRSVVSRESELLQSQIRQPIGFSATSPFRGQSNPLTSILPSSTLPSAVGPGRLAFNEFNPLFTRNGLALLLDGLIAEQDTHSYQAVLSGLVDNTSISIGNGKFSSDGFQTNRDFSQDATSVFFQLQANDRLSIQSEFLESRITRGDAFTAFDPMNAVNLRVGESSNSLRLSGRYELGPRSDIVVSGLTQKFGANVSFPEFDDSARFEGHASTGELQYLYTGREISLLMGANNTEGEITQPDIDFETRSSFNNVYLYSFLHSSLIPAKVEVGFSHDRYKRGDLVRDLDCPKVGLILNPTPTTTIRAAAAKSVKRPFLGERTVEPTHVAGFNQFFDDPDGAVAWQFGLAIDQELQTSTHIGFDSTRRNIEIPVGIDVATWSEQRERAYLYIPISMSNSDQVRWSLAFTAGLEHEEIRRPELLTGTEGIRFLNTDYLPLGVTIFPGLSTALQVKTTYVKQHGELQAFSGADLIEASSRFWISDISATHRLAGRRGKASIGVSNIENKHFAYVDSDPAMARYAPGRIAYGRITVQF